MAITGFSPVHFGLKMMLTTESPALSKQQEEIPIERYAKEITGQIEAVKTAILVPYGTAVTFRAHRIYDDSVQAFSEHALQGKKNVAVVLTDKDAAEYFQAQKKNWGVN